MRRAVNPRGQRPATPPAQRHALRSALAAAPRAAHACALGAALAAGAAAQPLRHDPFARPRLGPAPASGAAPGAAAPAEADPWRPVLRAVMQAGRDSVVNVDGRLVAIGETIDGYRLVKVEDARAVFSKDGRRTTLTMHDAGLPSK